MKQYFIILLLVFGSFSFIHAQDSGVSFEVHYPLDFEKETNQYSEVFGIFGGALQYQFTDAARYNFGVEYRFDLNQANRLFDGGPSKKVQFVQSHLNIFSKIYLDDAERFKGYVAGGFTTYKYSQSSTTQAYIGYNVGIGFNYDLLERVYIHSSYSYIKASKRQKQTDFVDDETRHIIRFGLGFKL